MLLTNQRSLMNLPFKVSINSLVNIRNRTGQRSDNSPYRFASTAIVFSCIEVNFFDESVQTSNETI